MKIFLALLLLLSPSLLSAASTTSPGDSPDYTGHCLSCHGENSARGPQLAGLKQRYILEQLHNYQQGLRGEGDTAAQTMAEAIRQYSSQQLEEIADRAAAQKGEQHFYYDRASPEPGASLFAEQCRGCHQSFMGRLMTGSPRLEYLDGEYMVRQLKLYASDHRKIKSPNKHQSRMIRVTKALSEEQLDSLIVFIRANTESVTSR